MLPVIALIGCANVGKSTVFNYLTQSRQALVADASGVTRDRQYGTALYGTHSFIVVDTGGVSEATEMLQVHMNQQTWTAVAEAHFIFWIVDARLGLTACDQLIATRLRATSKPVYLLVNKSDGMDSTVACTDFYATGFKQLFAISALQGLGISALLDATFAHPQLSEMDSTPPETLALKGIQVAIVGRPNAGKSTLVNRILGEERLIVSDVPGTTHDSIFTPFTRRDKAYVLIDTAGVRRRRSVTDTIEKLSVIKTLQAITAAQVVVLVIDARENLAEQDLHLLGHIIESGRSLLIAVNKWDNLTPEQRKNVEKALDRRLTFAPYVRIHPISALHGSGVGDLFSSIDKAYRSATRKVPTSRLTALLQSAVATHQPPAIQGRRIKLRYAHMGGLNPPILVIHGNQTAALPTTYQKYLANYFRKALSLTGTPVRIELRSSQNPYQDQKNVLTSRQVKRRQRLIRHVKKDKK